MFHSNDLYLSEVNSKGFGNNVDGRAAMLVIQNFVRTACLSPAIKQKKRSSRLSLLTQVENYIDETNPLS